MGKHGKSGTPLKINPRRSRGNSECMEEVRVHHHIWLLPPPPPLPAATPLPSLRARLFAQLNAFFTCMAKSIDVEDKCVAERRALTNCATAAVGGSASSAATLSSERQRGAWPQLVVCPLHMQARKGKTANTINYHLQRISRMLRR